MRKTRGSLSVGLAVGLMVMLVLGSVVPARWVRAADAGDTAPDPEPTWTDAQRQHWAFRPLDRPAVPGVKRQEWVRNPVDAFVLKQIEEFGLTPAAEADRVTLIRRLRFDLTGLPPAADEVDAFVADRRADAYERLVDRLLASPQYGERWARFWLDLARFAESDGFKSDKARPNAWRYRDWVVEALNRDMPYDRFVALQLAGDEVEPGDRGAFIATGFNRNWPFEDNNKIPGQNRQLMLDDMTDTTASVFLGLTVGCARCHDHKYDPISQKDYYRFQALFAAAAPRDDFTLLEAEAKAAYDRRQAEHKAQVGRIKTRIDAIEKPYVATLLKDKLARLPEEVRKAFETDPEERSAFQEDLLKKNAKKMAVEPQALAALMSGEERQVWTGLTKTLKKQVQAAPPEPPSASGMTDSGASAPPVFLLRKGNFANPGEEVPPGFLSVLGERTLEPPALAKATTTGRRTALAEWLMKPENPLPARVMVNRLWRDHFGRGIVATPSDFGTQGSAPTHPELLDWLASEFVARGWSLKATHRLLVCSATYRQSSIPAAEAVEADPENSLFSRMPRRRLEAEAVRDALLASSGQLDLRVGGPSVLPELPPGIDPRGGWPTSASAADRNRRSLYVFAKRNLKYPLFDAFDAPDSNVTCAERNVSVNAPQALMLLNSALVLDGARHVAGRVLGAAVDRSDLPGLLRGAYRSLLGRDPDAGEVKQGVAFLESEPELLSARTEDAKSLALPVPMPDGGDLAQGAALVDYCHVLINLNEFVFID
jgi:hypothetical protein